MSIQSLARQLWAYILFPVYPEVVLLTLQGGLWPLAP
ncbi:hypothetical protein IEO21_02196 [Rhodonia placenta]|uniref:Uncharacterized protein n=1 Tax=Rhodonia placenta TaxID=104341 RepID=A0A8H7U4P8_9APHY|nr:hypothetical protein IEO21_02196 [Postia placenta]